MSFVGTIDDAKDPTIILYAIHEISHAARSGHRGCWPGGSHRRGSARPERFAGTPMSGVSLPCVPGPVSVAFNCTISAYSASFLCFVDSGVIIW